MPSLSVSAMSESVPPFVMMSAFAPARLRSLNVRSLMSLPSLLSFPATVKTAMLVLEMPPVPTAKLSLMLTLRKSPLSTASDNGVVPPTAPSKTAAPTVVSFLAPSTVPLKRIVELAVLDNWTSEVKVVDPL